MADINIPSIQKSFYKDYEVPQIKDKINTMYLTYKGYFDTASQNSNVPLRILKSFAFIESGGNPYAVSKAGAVGLMQLIPSSASDILVIENMKGRYTDGEKKTLTKYLGNRFTDGILKMKYLGDKKTVNGVTSTIWVTKDDLMNPELSLQVGAIFLRMLLDEHTINGKIELHKVLGRYNMGYFSKQGLTKTTIEGYLSAVPKETKDYAYKLLGINSTMQILS